MDRRTNLKQTKVQMEGRTDRHTDWAECTNRMDGLDGRTDGKDRIDWTGQDGRTNWTDGGADRLDGRKDGLTGWIDWMNGWIGRMDGRTQRADEGRDGQTRLMEGRNDGKTRRMNVSEVDFYNEVGYLHDGVILLLRPESFSFFLSYLNFVNDIEVYCQTQKTVNT